MTLLLVVPLVLAIACATIGTIAFLRLATPFERLHAASFVAIATGVLLTLAAFATDGVSGRSLKMVLIVVVLTVTGAVANHAVARALMVRGGTTR